MDAELSALNLQDDFAKVLRLDEAARWQIDIPAGLEVYSTMSPKSEPEERYQARWLWTSYPDRPPSLKFRDPETGRLTSPHAWPQVRNFRPSSLDACVSWCAEGLNLIHPEWGTDPRYRWDSRGNVLLKVLRILQSELDEHYSGRYRG